MTPRNLMLKIPATIALALLFTFTLVSGSSAQTPPTAGSATTTAISLAPEKGLAPADDGFVYDFGKRAVRANEFLEHRFTLRNEGRKPVIIETLLTSCHCTTAELAGHTATDGSCRLAPGKSVVLKIAIDTGLAHAVDFRKMVWVYVKGETKPALTLTLTATLTTDARAQ
jgi:hypothetical protein